MGLFVASMVVAVIAAFIAVIVCVAMSITGWAAIGFVLIVAFIAFWLTFIFMLLLVTHG